MNINKLADDLSSLADLKIQTLPNVVVNTESAPRELIGQLIRRGYIPSYQSAPEDLKWLVEGEGNCQPDKTINVIDLLGVYINNTNKIILYDLLIRLCSDKLDIDYETLKQIVLTHELAHAITHTGKDIENNIWEYFDIALLEDKEYFAQIYTYKLFKKDNNNLALNVMDKLSENQLEEYNTYKKSLGLAIAEINKNLIDTRKKKPLGFEKYHEAKELDWKITFDNLEKYL